LSPTIQPVIDSTAKVYRTVTLQASINATGIFELVEYGGLGAGKSPIPAGHRWRIMAFQIDHSGVMTLQSVNIDDAVSGLSGAASFAGDPAGKDGFYGTVGCNLIVPSGWFFGVYVLAYTSAGSVSCRLLVEDVLDE
jgi:hypothetical protein